MLDREVEQVVKERLKAALEIPAQFAVFNTQASTQERIITMNMIEDILDYLDNWEENREILFKYRQHKLKEINEEKEI